MTEELRELKLFEMPKSWLEHHPDVPQRWYSDEVTERLRRNMEEKGFDPSNPLSVIAIGYHRYGVQKGNHRLDIAMGIDSLTHLPVIIDETLESKSELVFDAGLDNLTQQVMGPVDISLFINKVYLALREEHMDWSDTQTLAVIGQRYGLESKWINGLRALINLPVKVQDLIRRDKLSKAIAIRYLTPLIGTPYEIMLDSIASDVVSRQIQMRAMPWFISQLRETGNWPGGWPGSEGKPSYIANSCSSEDREKCLYVEACRKGGFKVG